MEQISDFLTWEKEMATQDSQDVGIFDPLLVDMWVNEHRVQDVVNAVNEESRKYGYKHNQVSGGQDWDIDIDIPPPDPLD